MKALDFEGILNYFRESVPKKFQSEEGLDELFRTAFSFKVCCAIQVLLLYRCISICTVIISALLLQLKERKLKDIEKDYPAYLEQQAELEDPVRRLEVSVHSTIDKYMTL